MRTMEELKQVYLNQVQTRKLDCITMVSSLQADHKEDESNFEKIKVNVYEIFTTLFTANEKKVMATNKGTDLEKYNQFCTLYLDTFNKIPSSWRIKLDYAIVHNLPEEQVIEELKLEVSDSLRSLFIKVKEEA